MCAFRNVYMAVKAGIALARSKECTVPAESAGWWAADRGPNAESCSGCRWSELFSDADLIASGSNIVHEQRTRQSAGKRQPVLDQQASSQPARTGCASVL